jgi:hypothetical protein
LGAALDGPTLEPADMERGRSSHDRSVLGGRGVFTRLGCRQSDGRSQDLAVTDSRLEDRERFAEHHKIAGKWSPNVRGHENMARWRWS